MEKLDKLFEKMSKGDVPNFLEVMAALSDIGYSNGDLKKASQPFQEGSSGVVQGQSTPGIDCGRFCSVCG